MPGSKFKGRLARLRELLDELEAAEAMRDADSVWHATESVLDQIYRLEQDAGAGDHKGFRALQESEDGRSLAGLIWLRGASVHVSETELREVVLRQAKTYIKVDGEMRQTRPRIRVAGTWREATPRLARAEWPQRSSLPPKRDDPEGRNAYDERVAGRPLMPPLRAAQTFLEAQA